MRDFTEIKYHCFISYTTRENEVRQVQPYIDRFIYELKARGVIIAPFFYDHLCLESNGIIAGTLGDALLDGVVTSACMISFVSSGYLSSPWCLFEWGSMVGVQVYRGPFPDLLASERLGLGSPRVGILPLLWKKVDPIERNFIRAWKPVEVKIEDDASFYYPWNNSVISDMEIVIHETLKFIELNRYFLEREGHCRFDDSLQRPFFSRRVE